MSKNAVPAGPSLKRKQQSLWNGDRFCSSCGEIIFGQARDNIRKCQKQQCGKSQPYTDNRYKFADGWGRCTGGLCGVIIQGAMRYCYNCGSLNEHYWKKLETDAMKKLDTEKKEAKAIHSSLEARLAEAEKKLAEQSETIVSQEREVFTLKQMKDIPLESDEEMEKEVVAAKKATAAVEDISST